MQLLAGALVTGVLVASAELLCRWLVTEGSTATDAQRLVEGDSVAATLRGIDVNPAPLVSDVELLWHNQPSVHRRQPVNPRPLGRNDSWTIENNSEGFRGPERQNEIPHDEVYRVLCVGDSSTFGFNVDGDVPFARRLEGWLRERYPSRHAEVINAGVPGWTWLQGLRFLQLRGLALAPDLVIIAHGSNDQFFEARTTDGERLRRESPFRRAFDRAAMLLAQTSMYRAVDRAFGVQQEGFSPGCRQQIDRHGVCRRVSLPEIEAAVREIRSITERVGADLLVLNLDFLETRAIRGVQAAVEREGIPFWDVVGTFARLRHIDEDERARALGLSLAGEATAARWREAIATKPASRMLFRVIAPHSKDPMSIAGRTRPPTVAVDEPMYDDGTNGDEVPSDGVWSALVAVPVPPTSGYRPIFVYNYRSAGAPEFQALPPLPSTMGDREVHLAVGDFILPIETLGDRYLMVEQVHPNARGHQIIAAGIAERLDKLASFARWADATR